MVRAEPGIVNRTRPSVSQVFDIASVSLKIGISFVTILS